MNFRYDINGLRAIAVIAVVLFHFNPAWVPGGFAGVDVFFVISGFLMTSIIFRGLEDDNFKLFKFYVARANRIIPALAVLCLVLLVFGWFYLTPVDYRALGKHVASSMGFLSNVIYWRESGYFDAASHEKWLLHTWSLSVEWQFYILYPIVLVALKKFLSLENLKRLIVIGTILGFVFSVIATMKWPNPAYYLLPTRAWEMMMGGVAFLYPWNLSESKKKIVEITGLALILGSYAFVSSDIAWPGHFSLIPVLGAYLMIIANRQSSFITNNAPFQYLGKCSYSIYLWHWPIVLLGLNFNEYNSIFFGLISSVVLGCFSYFLVEKRIQLQLRVFPVLLFILVVSTSAHYKWIQSKIGYTYESVSENLLFEVDNYKKNFNLNHNDHSVPPKSARYTCSLDGGGTSVDALNCLTYYHENNSKKILVIGDSHGRDFFHSLKLAYPEVQVSMLHQSSCSPSYGPKVANSEKNCFKMLDDIFDKIEVFDVIVYASRYVRENTYDKFIHEVKQRHEKSRSKVVIVNTTGLINKNIANYFHEYSSDGYFKMSNELLKPIRIINDDLMGLSGGSISVFDKESVFFEGDKRMLILNNQALLFDNQHLSEPGMIYLSRKIKESNLFD